MNKIVVYRTHIEINDYNIGDCRVLEKMFSVYDMAYHTYFARGRIYCEDSKVLMLPRGISIQYLENLFKSEAVIESTMTPITKIGQVGLKYKPRDDVQMEALKFMLSLDKYKNNARHTQLQLNLSTGKGKTYCSIAALAYLGMRSIIITNSNDWLLQWKNFILEYTDIKEDEIYYIAGAPTLMKLYNRDISKYKIILATHGTLKSIGDKNGWVSITKFFDYMGFGIKIYDEAHLNFDNMFSIDCYTDTFLTYYVTATPYRSSDQENNIYKLSFQNVPSIDLFDQDNDPHTEYIGIRYNSNPNPMQISECKNAYGMDRNRYTNYVVHQDNFYKMLRILLDKSLKKNGKSLYYIGTNDAILHVRDWIYDNYPELVRDVGIYTSIVPDDRKKEQLDRKIILSTTKSAGAAVDIPGLVETINLAEPFKSRVLAQQSFGRTRAENTSYKDIVDTAFYFTKKFYEAKKPIFMKYATDCKEINLRNEELSKRSKSIEEHRESLVFPMEFDDDR